MIVHCYQHLGRGEEGRSVAIPDNCVLVAHNHGGGCFDICLDPWGDDQDHYYAINTDELGDFYTYMKAMATGLEPGMHHLEVGGDFHDEHENAMQNLSEAAETVACKAEYDAMVDGDFTEELTDAWQTARVDHGDIPDMFYFTFGEVVIAFIPYRSISEDRHVVMTTTKIKI